MLRYARRSVQASRARALDRRRKWRWFWRSYREYSKLRGAAGQRLLADLYPCLDDATGTTPVEPTYFFQDAWAFEKILMADPSHHVDVGSHHRFVSFVSKIVPTTMVDLRPLQATMPSIHFVEGAITCLPFDDASLPSVSSICVVEHIGLGRYGDPLDPHGTEKALKELKRVVAPGGDLYVSLPVDDKDREYFNAHRAFSDETVARLLAPFELVERRFIHGYEFLEERPPGFGTGCYHLRRPSISR